MYLLKKYLFKTTIIIIIFRLLIGCENGKKPTSLRRDICSLNQTSSDVVFITEADASSWTALQNIINDESKRFFCFSPGDYSLTDSNFRQLKLTTSGTQNKKRYILLNNGNDTHPAKLNRNTTELARVAFNFEGASYWVIDRMAYWDGQEKIDVHNPTPIISIGKMIPSTNNTINRYYLSNVESGIYIYPESNNTTIKNCRLENNATYYKYDQAAIALHNLRKDNVSIINTKILNNEIVNFVDGVQTVNGHSYDSNLNYEGTIIENNLIYVDSQIYTDGNGTLQSDGNYSLSENAIDVKVGSSNINNPVIIRNNKMWGFRKSDIHGKSINSGFSSKSAPAMTIHYGVKNVNIDNNLIFDSAGGIYMDGETKDDNIIYPYDYSGKDINITNNIFNDISITLFYLNNARHINIQNNFLKNIGQYTYTFEDTTLDINFTNNTIFNGATKQNKNSSGNTIANNQDIVTVDNYIDLLFDFDLFTTSPSIKTVAKVIEP